MGALPNENLSKETKRRTEHNNFMNKIGIMPSSLLSALAHLHLLLFLPPPVLLSLSRSLSQWNLPAGVKAAGHLLAAAPVSEGNQRWECAHRREQPALLLQHHQLDQAVPHRPPEGADPQQPKPGAVL